jgi:hypothetical protein
MKMRIETLTACASTLALTLAASMGTFVHSQTARAEMAESTKVAGNLPAVGDLNGDGTDFKTAARIPQSGGRAGTSGAFQKGTGGSFQRLPKSGRTRR